MLRIGIVAGEASGDFLGAGLIGAIRARYPDAVIEGIGGPQMIAAGCVSHYPMERLAVMGLTETFGRLPELMWQRRRLARYFLANRPNIFIGVDSPDYNLVLERRLKAGGIPTVQYVSPQVWAWRRYRVRKIAASTNMVLALFPFEADFYRGHGVPVRFVGHPLADLIPLHVECYAARARLDLPREGEIIALLAGSRVSEVRFLAGTMIKTARWLLARRPSLRFTAPMVAGSPRELFERALAREGRDLPITLVDGQSREVMAAADVVLLASGTAALEATLLQRPIVVTYQVSPMSYFILNLLVKVDHVSIPNLLVGRELVPELMQGDAVPEKLGMAVLRYLQEPELLNEIRTEFTRLHAVLRQDANERAAEAVLELIEKG